MSSAVDPRQNGPPGGRPPRLTAVMTRIATATQNKLLANGHQAWKKPPNGPKPHIRRPSDRQNRTPLSHRPAGCGSPPPGWTLFPPSPEEPPQQRRALLGQHPALDLRLPVAGRLVEHLGAVD